ncbi:MAG: DUF4124 domain-containing protein [bacterium]|nr:DUF4124 domain-containing protein [bacterium]
MRRIGLVMALAAATLGGRALADDVYSWKDRGGVQHFGNAPASGAEQTGIAHAPDTFSSTADDGGFAQSDGPTPASDLSAADDLKRDRLGRELRTMSQRITAIDSQLAELARVRTRFAGGTPETGGLGTNAAGYLSPEEQTLVGERDQLVKEQGAIQRELSGIGTPANPAEAELLVDDAAAVASEPAQPVE